MNLQTLLPYGSLTAAAMPRALCEAFADRAGDLAWRLAPRAGAVAATNVRLVTGDKPTYTAGRGVFRTYARYYLAVMRLAHRSPEAAVGPLVWDGVEALDRSRNRGRGTLVLSAHLGNWDVLGVGLATRYPDVCILVEPLRPKALFHFYSKLRQRHGARIAPVGAPGRLPIEVLRRNGILALAADRPFGTRHTTVTCGQMTFTLPTGAIRLAVRSGAAVHACFAARSANGFRLHVGPDSSAGLDPASPESERVAQIATSFVAALRDIVQMYPDQWCVLEPLGAAPTAGSRA